MQNIFAYTHCKQANYNLAKDLLKENFAPDLNSMEPIAPEVLKANKDTALQLFENGYQERNLKLAEGVPGDLIVTVKNSIEYYYQQVKKDFDFLRGRMLSGVEEIYRKYLLLLLLPVELSDKERKDIEDKHLKLKKLNKTTDDSVPNLYENKILSIIRNNDDFQLEVIRHKADWKGEDDLGKQFFKELAKEADYQNYAIKRGISFEEDKEFLLWLYKNFVFKNPIVNASLEEDDMSWGENKTTVKSMVVKTIKGIQEDNEDFELVTLSSNWEDDKEFFIDIYNQTIENDKKYEELIAGKTKNWDIERIAALDKIILKMALNEMIHFPSIPVKVTINEYIEISKQYSTPKSRQFINGILDVLAEELQKEGIIKKSGRGLLDNK